MLPASREEKSYGGFCHSVISMLETMSQTQITIPSYTLSSVSVHYSLVMKSAFITNMDSFVFFFDPLSMQIIGKQELGVIKLIDLISCDLTWEVLCI